MDKIRTRIVDEAWLMRKIVERSLPQACIDLEKVVGARNGAEGLGALRAHQVDLCDINLPVMEVGVCPADGHGRKRQGGPGGYDFYSGSKTGRSNEELDRRQAAGRWGRLSKWASRWPMRSMPHAG
jgi:hypothetical protein